MSPITSCNAIVDALYHSFKYKQKPDSQTVGPVHPMPPHWLHNGATVAVGAALDVVDVEVLELVIELELGVGVGSVTETVGLHQPVSASSVSKMGFEK